MVSLIRQIHFGAASKLKERRSVSPGFIYGGNRVPLHYLQRVIRLGRICGGNAMPPISRPGMASSFLHGDIAYLLLRYKPYFLP